MLSGTAPAHRQTEGWRPAVLHAGELNGLKHHLWGTWEPRPIPESLFVATQERWAARDQSDVTSWSICQAEQVGRQHTIAPLQDALASAPPPPCAVLLHAPDRFTAQFAAGELSLVWPAPSLEGKLRTAHSWLWVAGLGFEPRSVHSGAHHIPVRPIVPYDIKRTSTNLHSKGQLPAGSVHIPQNRRLTYLFIKM